MNIHAEEIAQGSLYPSTSYSKAHYKVVGGHPGLGAGVLGWHIDQYEAEHNARVINEHGGAARVDPVTPERTGADHNGWLLVDDWRENALADTVVRNAEDACWAIRSKPVEVLFLDYSLGIGDTGLDVLEWALLTDRLPKRVCIVSSHPEGVPRIEKFLTRNRYVFVPDPTEVDGKTLPSHWRLLTPNEARPKRKVVVYLNR